ncbi:MAG: hypothetical protein ACD_62C00055G0004 [uncultured bacterium]|nr:MAG: hypothetical protein ACD_62C00055G0004 [uncultured bacterium]
MRTKNKDQRNSRNRVHVFTCSCVHDRQESSRIKGQRSTANGQLPMFGCKLLAVSRRLFVMSLVFGLWSLVFGCSTFYGGTTSSEGEQNITAAPTEIQVMADVNTVGYRTITFTNQSKTDNYEITNMAFVDNDCGAYSLYNILDEAGNMLYQTGDDIAVSVVPGTRVDINIRFSPLKCAVTQYTTTFIIYYLSGEAEKTSAVSLVTTVNDIAPDTVVCEPDTKTYYDEYDNPTERNLPALPTGQQYYLRVDKLSAFIQTTGAFAAYATQVSTHLYLDVIPEADRFKPVYIPFTTDDEGNIVVSEIDSCVGFTMPTPITDTFFIGAPVSVSTESEFAGSIDRDENAGRFEVPNLILRMASYINNTNSLLQSTEGYFDVNIQVANLTSGTTDANPFILDVPEGVDDEGFDLLNIVDDTLVGKDIRHGTVTLVGVGTFLDDDNTKLSNEAFSGIIDNEAYLFIQIQGLVTQAY